MHKSHFHNYDWFCAPGSHITLHAHTKLLEIWIIVLIESIQYLPNSIGISRSTVNSNSKWGLFWDLFVDVHRVWGSLVALHTRINSWDGLVIPQADDDDDQVIFLQRERQRDAVTPGV